MIFSGLLTMMTNRSFAGFSGIKCLLTLITLILVTLVPATVAESRLKRDAQSTTQAPSTNGNCTNNQAGKNITINLPLKTPTDVLEGFRKEAKENKTDVQAIKDKIKLAKDPNNPVAQMAHIIHKEDKMSKNSSDPIAQLNNTIHQEEEKKKKNENEEEPKKNVISDRINLSPKKVDGEKKVSTNITVDTGSKEKISKGSTRKPSGAPPSKASSLLNTATTHYDARDVTYFMEGHTAHSINDPRAYFTEERTTKSMAFMLQDLAKLPSNLKFAYVVRAFNELGRKIVSKMNNVATEVTAILRKTPDDLGNKPEVSMLVDAIEKAFESKLDNDMHEDSDDIMMQENPITQLINHDQEKEAVLNGSIKEVATRLGNINSYFVMQAIKMGGLNIDARKRDNMAQLLTEAMHMGAKGFITELADSDKHRLTEESESFLDRVFSATMEVFKTNIVNGNEKYPSDIVDRFKEVERKSFQDLSPLSDKTGMIGPWNTYLFTGLGSAERVVKLFGSLMSRVPPTAKSRWYNMYISQVNSEIQRTLSGFVTMQGMPHNKNESQTFLLNSLTSTRIMPSKLPAPRDNYSVDKNRIPARCYLAGRRWRMMLTRGLKGFASTQKVITGLADKMAEYKSQLVHKSGNEIYRMCMPRVEVGLRGWGINGDPQENGAQSGKFSLRDPIGDLNKLEAPFTSGAKLGYNLGAKIGYNEERNATLELEGEAQAAKQQGDRKDEVDVEFMTKASYRKAATAAANKAFQIAIREGYMATLKVSVRSGLQIVGEAGSRLSIIRCINASSQVGAEVGRSFADNYVIKKEMNEAKRQNYIRMGEQQGLVAGQAMGESIGALVGRLSAEEAFKRSIVRGGKLARAKFQLEEYETGAMMGFAHGLKVGKKIASSSTLDASAPRFFRLPKPQSFTAQSKHHQHHESEVDHWEKELIPPLSEEVLANLEVSSNRTRIVGTLKGLYKISKEVKKGLKRVSYSKVVYKLDVVASGYIMDNIAFLKLNGTADKLGLLRGSILVSDIFNDGSH